MQTHSWLSRATFHASPVVLEIQEKITAISEWKMFLLGDVTLQTSKKKGHSRAPEDNSGEMKGEYYRGKKLSKI